MCRCSIAVVALVLVASVNVGNAANPAARVDDYHVCPLVIGGLPPLPHIGGPILKGCPTVIIGGSQAARVTDLAQCNVGGPDVIATGSATVFIGGQPAARVGDGTAHGGVITTSGCTTVIIGP